MVTVENWLKIHVEVHKIVARIGSVIWSFWFTKNRDMIDKHRGGFLYQVHNTMYDLQIVVHSKKL